VAEIATQNAESGANTLATANAAATELAEIQSIATENAERGANDLATAQAEAEAAQATAEALIEAQSASEADVATAQAEVDNLQGTAEAVAATATVIFEQAGLDAIDQGKVEITIRFDAQGLLDDDPDADAAAIDAIQEAMEPYQDCRAAIVLTFGWHPNVGTGSAISAEVNDLLREAEPDIFGEAVSENYANIAPQGAADITLYFFRGCNAVTDD
jgi:hypothetical protein